MCRVALCYKLQKWFSGQSSKLQLIERGYHLVFRRVYRRKLAEESVVLLKNDGVLPLKRNAKIALVGPNANSAWAMLGDYTYQCMQAFWRRNPREWDKPHVVALKEGMGKLGMEVDYQRGCGWSNPGDVGVSGGGDPRSEALSMRLVETSDPTDFGAAVKAGAGADVIVCAMGENFTLWRGDNNGTWSVEPGEYEIRLARDAWDKSRVLTVRLDGAPLSFPRRTLFFSAATSAPGR